MGTILKVEGISGGYSKEDLVIKDVSFDINPGDFLGIIGPNGSGKSTLLKLISRVLELKSGGVFLSGIDVAKLNLKEFCKKVAFVPQDTTISFSFSVWEIVLMGRIPHLGRLQLETKNDYAIAESALSMTDTLKLRDRNIENLSAGERQRVIIAKALAQEPSLLLLDEPTSHLDIGHQIQILDLLKKLNRKQNLAIAMVMHDLNMASEYCNNIILINEGKVFCEGSPEEVLTYEFIEKVYKTVVVVDKNPISSKPCVFPATGTYKCKRD